MLYVLRVVGELVLKNGGWGFRRIFGLRNEQAQKIGRLGIMHKHNQHTVRSWRVIKRNNVTQCEI